MSLLVRAACGEDVGQIVELVRELGEYERSLDQVVVTEASMRRALFPASGTPAAMALIGELEGRVEGMALYFWNFSTWVGQQGVYLEDLYVRPAARGKGLGKALFVAVAREAVARGCTRMDWSVLDWNTTAIDFYKSMGAVGLTEWTVHRLSGEALARVGGHGG